MVAYINVNWNIFNNGSGNSEFSLCGVVVIKFLDVMKLFKNLQLG